MSKESLDLDMAYSRLICKYDELQDDLSQISRKIEFLDKNNEIKFKNVQRGLVDVREKSVGVVVAAVVAVVTSVIVNGLIYSFLGTTI